MANERFEERKIRPGAVTVAGAGNPVFTGMECSNGCGQTGTVVEYRSAACSRSPREGVWDASRNMSGSSLPVEDAQNRQVEQRCELWSDGCIDAQRTALIPRDCALMFPDSGGYVLLSQPFLEPRLTENAGGIPSFYFAVGGGTAQDIAGRADRRYDKGQRIVPMVVIFRGLPTIGTGNLAVQSWQIATSYSLSHVAMRQMLISGRNAVHLGGLALRFAFPQIRTEVRASNEPTCGALDVGAALGWDGPHVPDPLPDHGRTDTDRMCESGLPAADRGGPGNHFWYVHDRTIAPLSLNRNSVAKRLYEPARIASLSTGGNVPDKVMPTKESIAINRAISLKKLKKSDIATELGLTPGAVSQWATGARPVPPDKAQLLGEILGLDPSAVSKGYARLHGVIGNTALSLPAKPDQLATSVRDLQYALAGFASAMVTHRQAEARAVAAALRKAVPKRHREEGFVYELLKTLDEAG